MNYKGMKVLLLIILCLGISSHSKAQEGEGTSKAQKFEIRSLDTYRGDPLKGLNLGEEIKTLEFGSFKDRGEIELNMW